jgi:hypothetical protein
VSSSFFPCIFTNHFKYISFGTNIQTIYVMSPRWDLQIVDFSFHDFHLAFQPFLNINFFIQLHFLYLNQKTLHGTSSKLLAFYFPYVYGGFLLLEQGEVKTRALMVGSCLNLTILFCPIISQNFTNTTNWTHNFVTIKTITCLYLVVFFIRVHKSVTKAKSYVVLKQSPTSILLVRKFNPGLHRNSIKTFACIIRNNCLHANSRKTLLWRSESL